MFILFQPVTRLWDGWTRREWLRFGGLGAFGLSFPARLNAEYAHLAVIFPCGKENVMPRFQIPTVATLLLGLAGLLLGCGAGAAADDPVEMKLELKKGDFIIFFGDSLTALAGKEEPKQNVTKGYVRIVRETLQEMHKDKDLKVDWVATGGHKVTDLLKRVDADVLTQKPTIVFIQIGVNDANAGVTPEMFKAQLEELIGKLQKGGARVVLCSLTSLGEKHDGTNRIDQRLDELAEVARTVAREQKIPLNDLRKAFVEYWKQNNADNKPSGLLTYDGNHFNDTGHKFVAERMLQKVR
jgi:lysophospholipase L1-like esterase